MKTRYMASASLVATILLADVAAAQSNTRDQEFDEGAIIVTARKRQESILQVPVVETVVSAQQLERAQITDISRLTSRVPGLLTATATVAVGPQISIRGVGNNSIDAGVDQSVSLNLDGLAMSQGLAYTSAFFDLEQVEVLKGPQALFYGKNSPAGVVAVRTKDPTDELEIIARAAYETEARERRAELIVSTPINDQLGIRLAGMYSKMDGFFRNKATGLAERGGTDPQYKRVDDKRSIILRGTAVWKPSSEFSARLKVNYVQDKVLGNSSHSQLAACPDGNGSVPGYNIPFINPNDNCKLDRDYYLSDLDPAAFPAARNNGTPFFDLRQKFGSLELSYFPADDVQVTSVTALYRADLDTMGSGSQSGYAGPTISADNIFYREDFTQELRLDTDFSSPLNMMVGGYFQDGRVSNDVLLGGNIKVGMPAILQQGRHQIDIKSYSLFGQLRWKPADTIEFAGGLRWTDEERTNILVPDTKVASSNFSPEFTITYTPTDTFTLFGSVKQGYKSGSYTITTAATNPPFDDEKAQGGEIGLKTRLLDRSLNINLAGYFYKYKGLQVGTSTLGGTGIPVIRTLNAGGAETYGIDFDATYRPHAVDGLTLNTSINWNNAKFTQLTNVPCFGGQTISEGCNLLPTTPTAADIANGFYVNDPVTGNPVKYSAQDLKGLPLIRAPRWQLQAGFEYEMPLGQNKLSFGLDAQYTSKYRTALNRRPQTLQKGFTTFNANLNLADSNDGWELSLVGNNLGNKIVAGRCDSGNYANGSLFGGQATGSNSVGPAGVDEVLCMPKRGREVWLRLTVQPTKFRK